MRHQKYIDPYCIHLIMHLWMVCLMGVKKLHIHVIITQKWGREAIIILGVNYF